MSHLAKIEIEITDIKALKQTCARLGLEWKQDQKKFAWFGREPAACDHAIKCPNAKYEIGVTLKDGKYELKVDYYDRNLTEVIGRNGGLLKQAYAIEKAKMEAIRKGYSVREQKTQKGIELRIAVR